ncbi:MAG: hypothetical protein ABIK31_07080 [candidate division WOR-3 bacterium]
MVLLAEISIKTALQILQILTQIAAAHGVRIFLVGGPVRDLVMYQTKLNLDKIDLDIAVENRYYEIGLALAKKIKASMTNYPQFMTMTLQLNQSRRIDIAQTRQEHYPRPAALPKVNPALIYDDLARRDFTINAMAIEITPDFLNCKKYLILDPFSGQIDIKNKLIRILHPKSFIDDPTRIFRAIRFAYRFNFQLEYQTKYLLLEAIRNNHLQLLSGERILYELQKIIQEKKNVEILKALNQYQIFKKLYHTYLPTKFFAEQKLLSQELKLIHLFFYLPIKKWQHYPLSKSITENVKALHNFYKIKPNLIKIKKPSYIYKTLNCFPDLSLKILRCLESKTISNKIKSFQTKYRQVKVFTDGKTLQSLQIKPGPIYSQILSELKLLKLDGVIKNKSDEIEYIKQKYRNV